MQALSLKLEHVLLRQEDSYPTRRLQISLECVYDLCYPARDSTLGVAPIATEREKETLSSLLYLGTMNIVYGIK